jgi:hypothetical protein
MMWNGLSTSRAEVLCLGGPLESAMSKMETMERKKPRSRRSFTPESKAEIVEAFDARLSQPGPVRSTAPHGPTSGSVIN